MVACSDAEKMNTVPIVIKKLKPGQIVKKIIIIVIAI